MRSKLRWTFSIIPLTFAILAAVSVVRARRAADMALADVAHSGIPFETRPLSGSKPANIDLMPAPPDF
ncbi:MAG TPA: hypothetical protein VKY31_14005, partial [Terriglobia bacterium]|nr:hypothetical protein [Terriglobia bacterium]